MGYYLQVPQNLNKVNQLKEIYGKDVQIIDRPTSFNEVGKDKYLICVVNNGVFEAIGICYDELEFKEFNNPDDLRRKTWLLMPRELVKSLVKGLPG